MVGWGLWLVISGLWAEFEEAPLREQRYRAAEEQRLCDKEERRRREKERQAYDAYIASLPVAVPKADVKECIEKFRSYLNSVWTDLPSNLFEPNEEEGYKLIHTWLQRQFDKWVEEPLGCQISHSYGDWDAEYQDDLPWDGEPIVRQKPVTRPMEIRVNGEYNFRNLVSMRDGWHYVEPPFDHVLVNDYNIPGQSPRERYVPLIQADFELRPISEP